MQHNDLVLIDSSSINSTVNLCAPFSKWKTNYCWSLPIYVACPRFSMHSKIVVSLSVCLFNILLLFFLFVCLLEMSWMVRLQNEQSGFLILLELSLTCKLNRHNVRDPILLGNSCHTHRHTLSLVSQRSKNKKK